MPRKPKNKIIFLPSRKGIFNYFRGSTFYTFDLKQGKMTKASGGSYNYYSSGQSLNITSQFLIDKKEREAEERRKKYFSKKKK